MADLKHFQPEVQPEARSNPLPSYVAKLRFKSAENCIVIEPRVLLMAEPLIWLRQLATSTILETLPSGFDQPTFERRYRAIVNDRRWKWIMRAVLRRHESVLHWPIGTDQQHMPANEEKR